MDLAKYENSHEWKMPMPGKYKYIWAWGKMSGSMDYYIVKQIKAAIADNAPDDATFKQDDGKWSTIDEACWITQHIIQTIINNNYFIRYYKNKMTDNKGEL